MRLHVDSEVGLLRRVLLGSAATFRVHPPINRAQQHSYATAPPKLDVLLDQQQRFVDVLRQHGVAIHWANPRSDSPNQINVRDVATVIGDTLVIGAMKEPLRQQEPLALESLLASLSGRVLRATAGVVEGGDVLLDGTTLYVGLSDRTDPAGLGWLERTFGSAFAITPLRLQSSFLHLDVVFNLLGRRNAFIFPPAFDEASLRLLKQRYRTITVTADEQASLATNVLSLSSETVVSAEHHPRVNDLLKQAKLEVIPLDFSEIIKIGGSFRCSTCPLERDSVS